jgi:hypothetical protein
MRIRVTTRVHLFEERKREHIERGYESKTSAPDTSERIVLVHPSERPAGSRHAVRTGS